MNYVNKRKCKSCGRTFTVDRYTRGIKKFCNSLCRSRNWFKHNRLLSYSYTKADWKHPPVKCKHCGKDFPYLGSGKVMCSVACRLESYRKRVREYRLRARLRVFELLGGPKCVYCGCDELKVLEINHKNGGGAQEIRERGPRLYRTIGNGARPVNDLEVTCRVCNAWHYAVRKLGKDHWTISWTSKGGKGNETQ